MDAIRRSLGMTVSESAKIEKWKSIVKDWDTADMQEVRKLCGMGIPKDLRGRVWPVLAGSTGMARKSPGAYHSLTTRKDIPQETISAIRRDLGRTFPSHTMFEVGTDAGARGRTKMENILRAYAAVDPDVGYVQGLNYLAGVLLMHLEEEDAFWLFCAMMKDPKYRLNGLFQEGLGRLIAFFGQHEHLLYRTLPRLYEHFHRNGVRTSMYASAWYTTVFAASFPLPSVFRIWDVFLLEGADCLLSVAMAVLRECEPELLMCRELDSVRYLKTIPEAKLAPSKILREAEATSILNFSPQAMVQGHVSPQNRPKAGEKEKRRDHGTRSFPAQRIALPLKKDDEDIRDFPVKKDEVSNDAEALDFPLQKKDEQGSENVPDSLPDVSLIRNGELSEDVKAQDPNDDADPAAVVQDEAQSLDDAGSKDAAGSLALLSVEAMGDDEGNKRGEGDSEAGGEDVAHEQQTARKLTVDDDCRGSTHETGIALKIANASCSAEDDVLPETAASSDLGNGAHALEENQEEEHL